MVRAYDSRIMKRFRQPLVLALVLVSIAWAQEAAEPRVDFVRNTVEVEGVAVGPARFKDNPAAAYLSARQAAKVLADAQLGALLAGLYVDVALDSNGARRVREELPRTHVPGGIVVAQSSLDEFRGSGHVMVRVRYQMGDLMPLILGEGRAERLRAAHAAFAPAATLANPAPATEADGAILVVPGSFEPTLAPKVFNTSTQLVYSAASVSLETLRLRGVARYADTLAQARQLLQEQGVREPIQILAAVRGGTDLVLPDADGARLLAADTRTHFLEKGRVVIVLSGR